MLLVYTTNCCGCLEGAFFGCASVFLFFPFALGPILVMLLYCFVLSVTSPRGARHLFIILFYFLFSLFLCFFRFSLCQRIWIASIYMPYLSCPVRWQVIALFTLLTALQCSISVVVLRPQSLYLSRRKNRLGHWTCCMSIGRKNGLLRRTHTAVI